MGTTGAMVGLVLTILLVSTAIVAESPPIIDYGKPIPPPCPKNEVRRCQNTCPPDHCFALYAAFDCIANQTCVNGCYCRDGYLRIGRNGPCVPRDQCPPVECVHDPNARRGCGDKCGKTCADYNSNPICPKQPCKNDGCDCKEGYVHDTNQDLCVLPKDCTKPCKSHERWSPCLMGECVAKTCKELGEPLVCPANAVDPCPGGCICDYGYVRAKNGTCIDAKSCPSCGGDPNAQIGCGNPCGKTCASLNANKSNIVCPLYCEVNGCDCKEGYLLDQDAKPPRCVLVKDCPKPPNKCGKNEEYYCGPSCPDYEATCSEPNPPICINKRCEFKCFCKKGYVRDDKNGNVCITADKCPKKCPKLHERWTNCYLGECVAKTCEDLGKPLPCPGILAPCAGGCICETGFVRDENGKCIDARKCPSCGGDPNAQSGCGNPCGQTCASLRANTRNKRDTARASATACAAYCVVNGCDCKKGYILNTDVKPPRCVLPEDCNKPINCTKKHEVYVNCLAGQCGPKNCDDLGRSLSCPRLGGPCPGGCICKEGYLRDVNGNCIKMENCPPKPCGGNETWMSPCNAPCPYPRCPRDDKPPPPCVKIEPCYPGCQCKLNYLRNSREECILAPDCPPVNCTRPNEVWNGCPSACLAEGCDDINKQPTTCNTLIWLCSPRCVCKKGHFRNKDGVCIPASQCPSYCKDPNASWRDCRDICQGTCQNPKPICISKEVCRPGCQCKKGYVLDKPGHGGKCVQIEKCPVTTTTTTPAPPKCKSNEHWTDCLPGQCKPKTCDELITPAPCPRVIPPCPGGCICDDGYVWDATGCCIKKEDCPLNTSSD